MTYETPYLIYIIGAYALSLLSIGIFIMMTYVAWKKSKKLLNET